MDLLKTISNINATAVALKIKIIEKQFNIKVPDDLESFLLSSGDTEWLTDLYYEFKGFGETLLFGNLLGVQSIINKSTELSDELLKNTIIIGTERNDGFFYLKQVTQDKYEYGYYDCNYLFSEYMADENDINDDIDEKMNKNNTHFMANSLTEFLNLWIKVI